MHCGSVARPAAAAGGQEQRAFLAACGEKQQRGREGKQRRAWARC
jgi:hypothetical protein